MNEHTRYRITGSLFVAALAIIFLPMLFDGAGIKALQLPALKPQTGTAKVLVPTKLVKPRAFSKADALNGRVQELKKSAQIGELVFTLPSENSASPASGKKLSWGVQLGSFSSEENAQKFREKLIQDGHHAVLSRMSRSGGKTTRVAVGPMIRKSDAIKLRDKLSGAYQVEAIVVNFGH